jgi:hypothetical protein
MHGTDASRVLVVLSDDCLWGRLLQRLYRCSGGGLCQGRAAKPLDRGGCDLPHTQPLK